MKTDKIHETNTIGNLVSSGKFSSAIEYSNEMVGHKTGNCVVECEKLGNLAVERNGFKNNDLIKNEVSLEKIVSRQSFLIANDMVYDLN